MRTSILILLFVFLSNTTTVSAKKASAFWYFLAKTESSVNEDENINIQHIFETKYAFEEYDLYPYPIMLIKITNKSSQLIFVDLGTSFLKLNDVASVIYTPTITSSTTGQSVGIGVNAGAISNAIGIGGPIGSALNGVNIGGSKNSSSTMITYAQRIVSIPPKSTINIDNILIFPQGCENALRNLITYKEGGTGKNRKLYCSHNKFDNIQREQIYNFTERTTLFKIGCYINYSFSEDIKSPQGIETTYFVKKLIGSSYTTFPFTNHKIEIINKLYPSWKHDIESNNIKLIHLWH